MVFKEYVKRQMVDMHCHILPGIDDGASSIDETLKMLRIAYENGINRMIVTPHYKNGRSNADRSQILSLLQDLKQRMKKENIEVELFPGNEIFYYTGVEDDLQAGRLFGLNDTNRILVEFSPNESFQYIRNSLDSLGSAGFIPVLAHIERYSCFLRDFSYVEELCELGVEIQVNTSSIEGKTGRQIKAFVKEMLKCQYIDYLGTDAHDSKKRPPEVKDCLAYLYKKYDNKYIDQIVYINAMALIDAESD